MTWNGPGTVRKGETLLQVDLIFKIAAVGLLVGFLNMLLTRAGREEQAVLVTLAGLLAVLLVLVEQFGQLFDTIRRVFAF